MSPFVPRLGRPRVVWVSALVLFFGLASGAWGEVKVPSLFGSHMVLQRGKPVRFWGTANPGEKVSVAMAGTDSTATASDDGRWRVELPALEEPGPYRVVITATNTLVLEDVLVGEVWICSGQSNMAWPVRSSRDSDLVIRSADLPRMRLLSVPQVGTQEPQDDFRGAWALCSPETVGDFSAVGFFFGREIHRITGAPVGLIDNAWGGSAAEAWVRRDLLEGDERYSELMERWSETERTYDADKERTAYEERLGSWRAAVQAARDEGRPEPRRPQAPRNPLVGQHRPANLYNGVLHPIIGYPFRGVIWYQGEANAARAYQYRDLFPLMIQCWRDVWGDGDFPFYWVQLADFMAEQPEPQESAWAELREAQTLTLRRLPNTGQAVIIDLGEANDIHPKNKLDVGKRLARWALARDYGVDIPHRSPILTSSETREGKVLLSFEHVGGGLQAYDSGKPRGFAVAGEDRKFVWADARIVDSRGGQVEVWSDAVPRPVAVRYAWADNPVCNLQTREGLPVTPFRTDDWPGVTVDKKR